MSTYIDRSIDLCIDIDRKIDDRTLRGHCRFYRPETVASSIDVCPVRDDVAIDMMSLASIPVTTKDVISKL
jgi:hypothetical protein